MTPIKFEKNEVLFKQGQKEDWMFDIKSGKVGVYDSYGNEDEKLLAVLEADDFLGEMGMIENLPRSATAVALEDAYVFKITRNEFGKYFAEKPSKILTILQYASNRMRELTGQYLDVCKTLKEYVSLNEKGEKIPDDLMKKMKSISK